MILDLPFRVQCKFFPIYNILFINFTFVLNNVIKKYLTLTFTGLFESRIVLYKDFLLDILH